MSKPLPFSAIARRRVAVGIATAVSIGTVCAATADAAPQPAPQGPVAHSQHQAAPIAAPPLLTIPLPAGMAIPPGLQLPEGVVIAPAAVPHPMDNSPRGIAHRIVPDDQFASFDAIITHESGWNPHAMNPSGAYGLGQALPGHKMATEGADWHDNPETQVRWTYNYMNSRYGSPNAAWSFWQNHHWY